MSIANDIQNIYEFSKEKDRHFQDFAENLLCFFENHKEKTNINDIENFSHLIEGQFNDSNQNYKNILLNFIEEYKKQGFVDYQIFYNNFQKNFKIEKANNDLDDKKDDLMDSISSEILVNSSYVNLVDMMKAQQEASQNNVENTNADENTKENTESNQSKQVVMPSQVIAFIKDEKIISFPFSKESTLENKEFMKAFYADLNSRSNQELEMLLAKIRAKNEALKAEILNLKQQNQTNIQEKIATELEVNSVLSQEKKDLEKQSLEESHNEEQPNSFKKMNAELDIAIENQKKSQAKPRWWFFNKNNEKPQENQEEQENEETKKIKNKK